PVIVDPGVSYDAAQQHPVCRHVRIFDVPNLQFGGLRHLELAGWSEGQIFETDYGAGSRTSSKAGDFDAVPGSLREIFLPDVETNAACLILQIDGMRCWIVISNYR